MNKRKNYWQGYAILLSIVLIIITVLPSVVFMILEDRSALTDLSSFIGSVLTPITLVITALTLLFTRLDRHEDGAKSVLDGFWLRQIILPSINKEFEQFMGKYKAILSTENPKEEYEKSNNEMTISIDAARLRGHFGKILQMSKDHTEEIEEIIDALETYLICHLVADDKTKMELLNDPDTMLDMVKADIRIFEVLYKIHKEISM